MSQDPDVNYEPLPGYRLIERLGSGGYGEVWRAEAPGGLMKAIKFVFGKHDEKRASIEMRALDHVRSVRHPFLLSLERIEVVDGRLIVVTELAENSIKDRFDACRREGLRGIPRDELIGYLRDTADALDFMGETHGLQHLDIKPENLLLLAGHVKVADFGLVKDMSQSQASLVAGMTPLYAAPEVFRGTPSRHSDQYALGILYQEMLTGTLPFAGCNSAELTLQHLNDEPDLSPLATGDRYAVSRALAKDPQHRYETCRELVESLAKATSTATVVDSDSRNASFGEAPPQYIDDSSQQAIKTEFCDEGEANNWNAPSQLLAEQPLLDCRIIDLPPVDLAGHDTRPAPMLVLGIGGTAGRVLSQLRRSIHGEFPGKQLPAVQFLLLDTDSRALSSVSQGDAASLTADEIVNLPLRRPQHYRENSQQLLHWLSRRWLYNIPRSLRTEGLRPLGRLALADHSRQVGQRIRRAMSQAIDPESIQASNAASGREFQQGALRVMIVASISGGTGGGMALDIGFAVRAILQKLGVSESRVVGVMMHSTDRDARHSELARVNAYSWLSEFNHFQQSGNTYPGDTSCGLPTHPQGVTAFDQTYLLHLGENIDDTEFEHATQAVADYLRLDALSTASTFFDVCRDAPLDSGPTSLTTSTTNLRSFGLVRRTAASNEFCDSFTGTIAQHVLSTWVASDRKLKPNAVVAAPDATADSDCLQLVRRLQLDTASVVANVRALIEFQLGAEPTDFLSGWLKEFGAAADDCAAQIRAIDQMFSARYEGAVDGELSLLGKPASTIVQPLVEKLRGELRRWVMRRVNDPAHRVVGARAATQWVSQHFSESLGDLQHRQTSLAARIGQLNNSNPPPGTRAPITTPADVYKYFDVCLERLAASAAQQVLNLLLSDAKAMSDEVIALAREINHIAAAVSRSNTNGAALSSDKQENRSPSEARLAAEITSHLSEISAQVDARLQAEYLDPIGGLAKTIMEGGRPRAQLTSKLHELSRQAVHHAVARVNVLETAAGDSGQSATDDLRSSLALATPALLEFGGRRRTLVVVPREAAQSGSQTAISQRLGTAVTTICGTDSSLTLCVEADGLSLTHIALEFVERRRDRVDFAGRVHCRTDIAWTPLISTDASTDSSAWSFGEAGGAQDHHAMSKTVVL